METEWDPDWTPLPTDMEQGSVVGANFKSNPRLEALLPADAETGVAHADAFRAYLAGMMDMASRHGQKLSLLCVSADETPMTHFLGKEGAVLIGKAIARCLRQETRSHDVIGRLGGEAGEIPSFLVLLFLMDEAQAAPFAERLRETMTTHACGPNDPWLTLSVGLAAMSVEAADPEELIVRAAGAMHQARRAGGARVRRASDSIHELFDRFHREEGDSE